MKNNLEINKGSDNEEELIKTKKKAKPKKKNYWAIKVLFITLALSFSISLISELVITRSHIIIAYVLIAIILLVSVVCDIIGTAATACDVQPFLAMAARKVHGAKKAVVLCKKSEIVSSICADVIGDICGIVAGACGATIVAKQFIIGADTAEMFIGVAFSAVIAALTVTGKAIGKTYAVNNSNDIVLFVARALSIFEKK